MTMNHSITSFDQFFGNVDDAHQIIPRLWLGNFNSSQDVNFLNRNRVSVVVNCTKDLPFLKLPGVFKYIGTERIHVHSFGNRYSHAPFTIPVSTDEIILLQPGKRGEGKYDYEVLKW